MSATADYVLAGELAVEATSLHLLGQYDASLQTLQRLEGQLLEDPSVSGADFFLNRHVQDVTC